MDKYFYKQCIDVEVDHWSLKGDLNVIRKIQFRYLQPESNAIYLIRKKQYVAEKTGLVNRIRVRFLEARLMRRYGIHVGDRCKIDIGFKIFHPNSIVFNDVEIGKNFLVEHNCTIGLKNFDEYGQGRGLPRIGNNVRLMTGSSLFGDITVCDDVTIGANSVVIRSISEPGVYVGSPARKVK